MVAKLLDPFFSVAGIPVTVSADGTSGVRRNRAASVTETYVVCLDCGKELPMTAGDAVVTERHE